MNVRIRPYDLADQAALVHVIDSVCAECAWMSTRRFQPTPAWIHALNEPNCPRHLLLVAENRQIVGWCRLLAEREAQTAIELGIGLLPSYRHQGIGTELVRSALKWAAAAGYRCVTLTVHPDNAHARHVFERCGFQYGAVDKGRLMMTCVLCVAGEDGL